MMALTRIYAPSLLLCLFILAHFLDPQHGDDMTDIDQSVLACSHTFNVQSSSPHSSSAMLQLTCQQHPPRPYCQQQAPRPTFCACLTLQRTSSLALPQDLSPSCSILNFRRPSIAEHPRASFSSSDHSTALFWTTSTRFDLRETSVTTFTFFSGGFFLLGPYSPLQI